MGEQTCDTRKVEVTATIGIISHYQIYLCLLVEKRSQMLSSIV